MKILTAQVKTQKKPIFKNPIKLHGMKTMKDDPLTKLSKYAKYKASVAIQEKMDKAKVDRI